MSDQNGWLFASAKCRQGFSVSNQNTCKQSEWSVCLSKMQAWIYKQVEWFFRFFSAKCRHRSTRKQNGPLCFFRHNAHKGFLSKQHVFFGLSQQTAGIGLQGSRMVLCVSLAAMQTTAYKQEVSFRFVSAKCWHRSTKKAEWSFVFL